MQVAGSQFAGRPAGHRFQLRPILSKVNARKCADCGADVFEHTRSEVDERDLLLVLDTCADDKASVIVERELMAGSFKAMVAHLQADETAVAINCAGTLIHSFLPKTRPAADSLRMSRRLLDLEWEDSETFKFDQGDVLAAIQWANDNIKNGRVVVINCAQGKSRTGALLVAMLVHNLDIPVRDALALAQSRRPVIEPNPGFMTQLNSLEDVLRTLGRSSRS